MSQALPNDPQAANSDDGRHDERPNDFVPRVVSSETLLRGANQLAIHHNQTVYFLRQTRFGKLILTK
jgi:hemin uptake protein HemP